MFRGVVCASWSFGSMGKDLKDCIDFHGRTSLRRNAGLAAKTGADGKNLAICFMGSDGADTYAAGWLFSNTGKSWRHFDGSWDGKLPDQIVDDLLKDKRGPVRSR